VWNQSGVKELVTINAPKKIEPILTNGLSEMEVHSRLQALANTIDSRGWAVKNVNINAYSPLTTQQTQNSDRLIDISNIPSSVPDYDTSAYVDMLDENTNPLARQFDTMINKSTEAHRHQLVDHLDELRHAPDKNKAQPVPQQNDYWFMDTAELPAPIQPTAPAQIDPIEEAELVNSLKQKAATKSSTYGHMKTLHPLSAQPPSGKRAAAAVQAKNQPINPTPPPMTPTEDPAIMALANNDDLNLETLGREAGRTREEEARDESQSNDEVVVPLH
jgi:hypothetical protein